MKKDLMTEQQVLEVVTQDAVNHVQRENAEETNRLMDCGLVEFSGSCKAIDKDGDEITLIAYYYQSKEDYENQELDNLDWEIEGYEVV